VFADESGFLLIPHVAKTWSPQGCTPVHYHRQGRRDKFSVISGISVSPQRQRLGLYYHLYFDNIGGDYHGSIRLVIANPSVSTSENFRRQSIYQFRHRILRQMIQELLHRIESLPALRTASAPLSCTVRKSSPITCTLFGLLGSRRAVSAYLSSRKGEKSNAIRLRKRTHSWSTSLHF
jgi:hypothetical protein